MSRFQETLLTTNLEIINFCKDELKKINLNNTVQLSCLIDCNSMEYLLEDIKLAYINFKKLSLVDKRATENYNFFRAMVLRELGLNIPTNLQDDIKDLQFVELYKDNKEVYIFALTTLKNYCENLPDSNSRFKIKITSANHD